MERMFFLMKSVPVFRRPCGERFPDNGTPKRCAALVNAWIKCAKPSADNMASSTSASLHSANSAVAGLSNEVCH